MFCSACGAAEQTGTYCGKCGSLVQGVTTNSAVGKTSESNGLAISGIVLGIVAFFFFPIVLGPIGLILGIIAKTQGQKSAVAAIVIASAGTVVGMFFGAMVGASLFG